MEDERQITKWDDPESRMEANFLECPECHTIGTIKHELSCSKPTMERKRIKTTQFGPCKFGQWCGMMRDKLAKLSHATIVKTNDEGQVALFDVV